MGGWVPIGEPCVPGACLQVASFRSGLWAIGCRGLVCRSPRSGAACGRALGAQGSFAGRLAACGRALGAQGSFAGRLVQGRPVAWRPVDELWVPRVRLQVASFRGGLWTSPGFPAIRKEKGLLDSRPSVRRKGFKISCPRWWVEIPVFSGWLAQWRPVPV